jgi:hypothetical protein
MALRPLSSKLALRITPRQIARLVVTIGLLIVVGALALDMRGRATRSAGSDHTATPVFAAAVPAGGLLCQPSVFLPGDTARVQLLIGTYGHPVPDLRLRFTTAAGAEAASAHLPAGAKEGLVKIPIKIARGQSAETLFCLQVGASTNIVLGGEGGAVNPGSEVVNGTRQPGRVGMLYFRRGGETWWQLLPTLTRRFGLGKASLFGDWTLPAVALLLLMVWIATARLVTRELT